FGTGLVRSTRPRRNLGRVVEGDDALRLIGRSGKRKRRRKHFRLGSVACPTPCGKRRANGGKFVVSERLADILRRRPTHDVNLDGGARPCRVMNRFAMAEVGGTTVSGPSSPRPVGPGTVVALAWM